MQFDYNDFEWIVCDTFGQVLKTQKDIYQNFLLISLVQAVHIFSITGLHITTLGLIQYIPWIKIFKRNLL